MEQGVATAVLCIVAGGVTAQVLAARFRVPAIVLLLGLGYLVGPVLGLLHPSEAFGANLRPLIGLAVAVVVFEGGLALDFRELRAAGAGVLRLTAIALPINFVLGTLAAHLIGGMLWGPAAVFGAILVVTGPTVILPLLRHARLERRSAAFLKWEAIVNDPVGAILTAIVIEILVGSGHRSGEQAVTDLVLHLAEGAVAAAILGVGFAFLVAWAFRRDLVSETLKTPVLLALALVAYAVPNLLMHEAGLIGATVFGIALANLHVPGIGELRRFKEALVVLLVSCLFVVLTADLNLAVLGKLSLPILALTAATLFVVRPASIWLATWRSDLTWRERLFVGWIGPRGIVAAAVAGLAGPRLSEAGYAGGDLIQPTVFAVIVATVFAHGFSLAPLARRLGLSVAADAERLAIVGASPWSSDLAVTLHQAGVPVLLVDTYPGALRAARSAGVPTLQAELLSRHAEEGLADQPPDYLLAATRDELYNALVCTRLGPELGRERVYQLAPSANHLLHAETGVSRDLRGKVLSDGGLDFETLAERHGAGWRFSVAPAGAGDVLANPCLLVIRSGGRLDFLSPEHELGEPEQGDRLVLLSAPCRDTRPASDARSRADALTG
ncbi:cation:proton antiporter [Methylobacterium radiotolerans]|jgi:NhaP-type Na+/H+ or K+/H+ antiporter|uniref:cation:proton antiporter n=1 Tax=Methylobacterium radiotolerans TaxID=31998 RepID=UPI000D5D9F46|nr:MULTISPECIES: sodium:proton antiporter [Methylobacterium]MDE3744290.1 sodium:proton antiporter [Methylobacterium radiotolerans]PVZ07169.1 sodium/proton antiporter (CPA1 family) [Methylobacterium organophilum]